nr:S8 family serine peptidase [Anaerolineae bacterium]
MGSPGSYPESITIGATDDLDRVASFSGRGPSPWDEIKPEVSAPGTQIRSSLPGGTFGLLNGTSMASPHVAGVAALLLQADPHLGVNQIEAIMTSTALPVGEQIPNNDTGWGRIDAYRAAAVASQAGYVEGQVLRQPDLEPLPYSLVTAYDREGQPQGQVAADEAGRYSFALPEGIFDLEASAFGYEAGIVPGVAVSTDQTVVVDFELSIAPAGVLWGQVTNTETGGPASVQVSVEGTPALTVSDPQTGQYSMALPAGTYTVTVGQNGYRRSTVSGVEIVVEQATRQDFFLAPAPTLLLVDSGRWYYGSKASYFESALDDRDYVYDLWEIRDVTTDIPQETDLAPFDITIWSSPLDSPGLIGAGDIITGYLKSGGNLFLTGQDVGYWDGGLNGWIWHNYYKEFLKAVILADDAGRSDVVGLPGEILEGLTLPLNGSDSARNQVLPDLIDVIDPLDAKLIGVYDGVGGAAMQVSGCQSYNAVYLASGLEGLGDQATRAEVMDRALAWIETPHPGIAVRTTPLRQETVWLNGSHITYTVELQNRGSVADRFDLELSPSTWPVSIWDASLTGEITQSLSLGSCQTQTLAVQVTVPPDAGWDITDVVTITARSRTDPGVTSTAVLSTKTPAPILLVDDHRWYDTSDHYRSALGTRGLPYDTWRIEQTPVPSPDSLSLERLERYPVVIWFTAYDWYRTLTPEQEKMLSAYLDGGGRLLLSSQDYLYTSGFTAFARDYLGVDRYSEGFTVTEAMGAVGHPVGNGLPSMELAYPFGNFSDAVRPSPWARIAFWGQHGQPVALTTASALWKTAFYAFALEAFSPDDMAEVMGSAVDWLSPLGDSTLEVIPPVVTSRSELTCTLSVRNTGSRLLSEAALSNPVPPSTSFVQGSLEGPATYDPATRRFTWAGALAPGQAITVTYRLQIDRPLPDGTRIENVATLSDETGLSLERVAASRVDGPYLGGSTKIASAAIGPPGHVLTYTLNLRNDGLRAAQARLTDPIPANSSYLPGSGWASSGLLTSTEQLLVWSGTVGAGEVVTITIPVTINKVIQGLYVHNRASLEDGWGDATPLETYTLVGRRVFLPLI